MLSKTHITVGVATALSLTPVSTSIDCAVAIAGGAIGGVIADVDTLDNDWKHDARNGEIIAVGCILLVAFIDYIFHWNVVNYLIDHPIGSIIGLVGLIILWLIGYYQPHRGFTHSFFAMILYSICCWIIYLPFGVAFTLGYASHLFLDFFNKRGIQLLFPIKKRICLKLCYSYKTANKVIMWVGLSLSIIFLILRIIDLFTCTNVVYT